MRNLTIVTKNLLIINVLAFIATWVVKVVGMFCPLSCKRFPCLSTRDVYVPACEFCAYII